MEEAFQSEGRTLTHLIGPGVEHKYEPKTLEELLQKLHGVVENPPQNEPDEIHLQTRTLRYPRIKWVEAMGLEEHWKDSRIDAKRSSQRVDLRTKNITSVRLLTSPEWAEFDYFIDGQSVGKRPSKPALVRSSGFAPPPRAIMSSPGLVKEGGRWRWYSLEGETALEGKKTATRQGPIDDAFLASFIVVSPTGKSLNPAFQQWCDAELQHFRDRWKALMRADLPEIDDVNFDLERHRVRSVILWGDADSNAAIKKLQSLLPVKFNANTWSFGGRSYDGNKLVPSLIYPSGYHHFERPDYVVLNSGLTFREGHDRTNSQQSPKLPDWAIIDITQPPDAFTPGRIHDADFFDEQWQLKRQPKGP